MDRLHAILRRGKLIIAFNIVKVYMYVCMYLCMSIGRVRVSNAYTIHVHCISMCDLNHIKQ